MNIFYSASKFHLKKTKMHVNFKQQKKREFLKWNWEYY